MPDFRTMSDELVKSNTGKTLKEWFLMLDRFQANTKGHMRNVKYLIECYRLNAWWAQAVLMRYEYEKTSMKK